MADLMRTSNPALNDKVFRGQSLESAESMTLQGSVNKTGILLFLCFASAVWTWRLFNTTHSSAAVGPWLVLGSIGGFLCALCIVFKHNWAPVLAPVYAVLEGLALGGISAIFELRYPGIAMQSVALTFGTLFVLLIAYSSGWIKVTEKFRLGIIAATGAIALLYVTEMVLGLFHIHFTTINGSGPIGIGFSLFIVAIAALNLVLDFDFIESGVRSGAPKYMEWYGAFGLMVTLIWLYLEVLRLLGKTRSRN